MRGQRDTRPCSNCGALLNRFISQTRGKNWYCGAACQAAHAPAAITQIRVTKETRICPQCGTSFQAYPTCPKECCSQRCSSTYKPRKPRRGTETACEVCGKLVYANAGQRAKGQGRFCSVECMGTGYTKPAIIKACPVCGKEMRLKPSQAHLQTCSLECRSVRETKRPLERTHNGKAARKDSKGYVMVYEPDHPNKSFHGWQYEHRIVVEKVMGRYLASDEHVHHCNGIKDDNRPANLEVMAANDHAALSGQDYRDSINRQLEELAEYKRRHGPLIGG